MGFSRQESWSGLPFPSLGDLPDPGTEPGSLTLLAHTLPSEPPGKPPGKDGTDFQNHSKNQLHLYGMHDASRSLHAGFRPLEVKCSTEGSWQAQGRRHWLFPEGGIQNNTAGLPTLWLFLLLRQVSEGCEAHVRTRV